MLIDLSVKVSKIYTQNAISNARMADGHLGTHFDVMNKEFPLRFTKLSGIIFDVSGIVDNDISLTDTLLSEVRKNDFVMFHTGFISKETYGTKDYFTNHPQLSNELIDALLEKNICIIGIDCAGVRRGSEHTPKDQYCADRGVFIIENLCNLEQLLNGKAFIRFNVNTFPVNFEGMSGLPCRVVAEI